MRTNIILQGDALEKLKELPDESVNCVMTSPPYWALRDYGIEGQLGLEPTFEEYINKLCGIFDEVQRVLRNDGTCWVNIGDTYSATRWSGEGKGQPMNKMKDWHRDINPERITGLPDKCLTLIPFRFAIEMVNRDWILRNTIIWHKRMCMPSSVKDRFTVDFEYLFFFVKNKKYWFETQREPHNKESLNDMQRNNTRVDIDLNDNKRINIGRKRSEYYHPLGRNKRTVWVINPQPFGENVCMICGYFSKPKSKVEKKGYFGGEDKSERVCNGCGNKLITSHFAIYPEELCWTPIKAGCKEGGIVLDIFFGAGTTGLVALKQNKKFIGIELNQEYIEIAKKRLKPYLEQKKLK